MACSLSRLILFQVSLNGAIVLYAVAHFLFSSFPNARAVLLYLPAEDTSRYSLAICFPIIVLLLAIDVGLLFTLYRHLSKIRVYIVYKAVSSVAICVLLALLTYLAEKSRGTGLSIILTIALLMECFFFAYKIYKISQLREVQLYLQDLKRRQASSSLQSSPNVTMGKHLTA